MTMKIAVKTGTTKALVKAWTMMTDADVNAICDEDFETGKVKSDDKYTEDKGEGAYTEEEPWIYFDSDSSNITDLTCKISYLELILLPSLKSYPDQSHTKMFYN